MTHEGQAIPAQVPSGGNGDWKIRAITQEEITKRLENQPLTERQREIVKEITIGIVRPIANQVATVGQHSDNIRESVAEMNGGIKAMRITLPLIFAAINLVFVVAGVIAAYLALK